MICVLSAAVIIAPEPALVIPTISDAVKLIFAAPVNNFPFIFAPVFNAVAVSAFPVNSFPVGIIIPSLAVNLPAIA